MWLQIHQPSAQIFKLFDTICLLGEGGCQAYFGQPAGALKLARHRQRLADADAAPRHEDEDQARRREEKEGGEMMTLGGGALTGGGAVLTGGAGGGASLMTGVAGVGESVEPLPHGISPSGAMDLDRSAPQPVFHLNPAEELLEYLVAVGQEGGAAFESSPAKAALDASVSEALAHAAHPVWPPTGAASSVSLQQTNGEATLAAPSPSRSTAEQSDSNRSLRPGGFAQFELLTRRGLRQGLRDPSLMFLQLVVTLVVAVITGLLFYQLGMDLTGVHNRTGLLFFVVIYFSLISMSSIGAIINDKETFLRERAAGLYTTEPFFASKVLCDLLPLRLLPPTLFGLVIYPLCDLHRGRMGIFIGATLLLNATASAMCFFAAAVSKTSATANLWASLFFIYNMCFGGLLLTANATGIIDLMQLSFFFHAYEILMVNEFDGYEKLEFNPSHSSLNGKAALISGKTWLVNVGAYIVVHKPALMTCFLECVPLF